MRTFKHKKFNGRDLSHLKHELDYVSIPVVKGRTLHIDADFLAYMVSYDATKSLDEMKHNCDAMIERLRAQSGAEHVALHLTHKDSDKGGRYDIAIQREYQGNRKNKPKPKYLNVIRKWMEDERGAFLYKDREADDGMAEAQYKAEHDLTIIATKDKDLCMLPGLQIDWDTGEITDSDDWGYIELEAKESKNKQTTYKLRGRGNKFFWAQLLMGDTADNVKGLPKCIHEEYTGGKAKPIGPVLTYNVLKDVKNNKEAWSIVQKLFKAAGEHEPFVHWKTGEPATWREVLASEMQILWMRRKPDAKDVFHWLKEQIK